MNEENVKLTKTVIDQQKTENSVKELFKIFKYDISNSEEYSEKIKFDTNMIYNFASSQINNLNTRYQYLDVGMPWLAYWILNILQISNKQNTSLNYDTKLQFVKFLKELQNPDGGFAGYSHGITNIASCYSAVLTIALLGIEEGYKLIDVAKMREVLLAHKNNNFDNSSDSRIKDSKGNFAIDKHKSNEISSYNGAWPGGFQMHKCSESDLRSSYCALVVADLIGILDEEAIRMGVAENISKCQSPEGGLSPEPYCEAHGGTSFCGIASLVMLKSLESINIDRFLYWITNRQMKEEGGFSGRTNKLVDSCYSFWQGAVFNLLLLSNEDKYNLNEELLYDQLALQAYLYFCCSSQYGFRDKPGKSPEIYHSNYSMCGLSLSQNLKVKNVKNCLTNDPNLELNEINPIYGIQNEFVVKMKEYFTKNK